MADPADGDITPASVVRLRDDIDRVRVRDDELALQSDLVSIRLRGASVDVFDRVLARLDGVRTVAEVLAGWEPSAAADGIAMLAQLHDADVVDVVAPAAADQSADDHDPYLSILAALGVGREGIEHLRGMRVGVVGLEGAGAHAATILAASRIGTIVAVDPFPTAESDLTLWPAGVAGNEVGRPRQDAVADLLARRDTQIDRPVTRSIDRDDLIAALHGCDIALHTFDKGFAASAMWVNEWSLDAQRPALYGLVRGHRAIAGPLVFPGEGPCYLCARMRSIACADDFDLAMGLEEELDRQRMPKLAQRPTLPHVTAQLGSVLATEVLKAALAIGRPTLAARIVQIDALDLTQELHPVLQHPACPACRKKGHPPRRPNSERSGRPVGMGLPAAASELVGRAAGVVRALNVVPKDPMEPAVPIVVRAELANHRFVGPDDEPFEVCSGKGMTLPAARISALGEACERYAGGSVDRSRFVRGRREDMSAPTLDPRELVLFADHQYRELRYAPWQDSLAIDWIGAVDLSTGEPLFVPAISAAMHYTVEQPDEFLFAVTSNGLAGGASRAAATLAAALEVIERDAFTIGWLQRLPPSASIVASTVPDEDVRALAEAYRRRRIALELYQLRTDVPVAVVAAVGVDESGGMPAAVVGLGCHDDLAEACRQAAMEVGQVRPALKARLREPAAGERLAELVADHSRVTELEDHDLLYAASTMLAHLDVWRSVAPTPFDGEPAVLGTGPERLDRLVEHLSAIGTTLIEVDLDAPDLTPLGLHTSRAIIPGFQPIHFGAREARLGGRRLYELPPRLGLPASGPMQVESTPHPLA